MIRTKEENEKIKEALVQIAEFCKEIALEVPVYIDNGVRTERFNYKLSITKAQGIGAWNYTKYGTWKHVNASDYGNELANTDCGATLVYEWKRIKPIIIGAIENRKVQIEKVMNFEL